jgi:CrcB protein
MIGVALISFERWPFELPRAFVISGFLGGLTTFSAFSGESLQLLQRGQWVMAVLHAGAHVFGSLVCVAAGFAMARWILRA